MMDNELRTLVQRIEFELCEFYKLKPLAYSHEHLLAYETFDRLSHQRAQVFIHQSPNETLDTLEIAIGFDREIAQSLVRNDPFQCLSNENLDAFWVLVEEISHFHLIINRASQNAKVSFVELEWQAEIDKLLLSAIQLHAQVNDAHYHHLARALFEQTHIFSENASHYFDANRYAARFWYDLLSYADGIHDPKNSKFLKEVLRTIYKLSWEQKHQLIFNPKHLNAA